MNADERFHYIARLLQLSILDTAAQNNVSVESLSDWKFEVANMMYETYCSNRETYVACGDAAGHLGRGSQKVYTFVRHTLQVPLLHSDILRTPVSEHDQQNSFKELGNGFNALSPGQETSRLAETASPPVVGAYMTKIYRAVRNGTLLLPVMDSLRDTIAD